MLNKIKGVLVLIFFSIFFTGHSQNSPYFEIDGIFYIWKNLEKYEMDTLIKKLDVREILKDNFPNEYVDYKIILEINKTSFSEISKKNFRKFTRRIKAHFDEKKVEIKFING